MDTSASLPPDTLYSVTHCAPAVCWGNIGPAMMTLSRPLGFTRGEHAMTAQTHDDTPGTLGNGQAVVGETCDALRTAGALAAPFDPLDVHWKPKAVSGNRALAVPYLDARAIMDRLDSVV